MEEIRLFLDIHEITEAKGARQKKKKERKAKGIWRKRMVLSALAPFVLSLLLFCFYSIFRRSRMGGQTFATRQYGCRFAQSIRSGLRTVD